MFSYYGSKSKIAHLYPFPEHDLIIEPFAGSAQYALRYCYKEVVLLEINPIVHGIWNWLIKEATEKDIRSLPELSHGDDLRKFTQLSKVERDLLGFCVGEGREIPGNVVTARAAKFDAYPKSDSRWRPHNQWELTRWRLLRSLSRIKHWKCFNISYQNYCINRTATWYIDPPYKGAGERYPYSDIDYAHLANWCLSRKGQVIVCEGINGDWLPFRELPTNERGSQGKLIERIYTQGSTWSESPEQLAIENPPKRKRKRRRVFNES